MIGNLAICLTVIAKHHVKVPTEKLRELGNVRAKLAQPLDGLAEKNRIRLQQFDAEHNVRTLLWFSRKEFDRLKVLEPTRRNALAAQIAIAVELLINAPMRITNLANLRLDTHLRWRGTGRQRVCSIFVPGHEVKNRQDIHVILPRDVSNLLRQYLDRYRPKLTAGSSHWLFPGSGDRAKRADTLSKQIAKSLWARCGIRINPHLFRHITGKLLVEAQPGNYEAVRRILGHTKSDTTYKHYQGSETKSAVEAWHSTLSDLRGMPDQRRRRPRA